MCYQHMTWFRNSEFPSAKALFDNKQHAYYARFFFFDAYFACAKL